MTPLLGTACKAMYQTWGNAQRRKITVKVSVQGAAAFAAAHGVAVNYLSNNVFVCKEADGIKLQLQVIRDESLSQRKRNRWRIKGIGVPHFIANQRWSKGGGIYQAVLLIKDQYEKSAEIKKAKDAKRFQMVLCNMPECVPSHDSFEHTTVDDLLYIVQHEMDLYDEGEEQCMIKNRRQYQT